MSTNTQASTKLSSANRYFKALSDAQKDGKRVLITRTREESRLIAELEAYTFAVGVRLKVWDFIKGWTVYGDNLSKDKTVDQRERKSDMLTDPIEGVRVVHAGPTKMKTEFDPKTYPYQDDGLYVMNYSHWPLAGEKPHPVMLALLKSYSYEFPATRKLLVIITPETFIVPEEMQDNVSIVDFLLPNTDEHSEEGHILLDDLLHAEFDGFRDTDLAYLKDHPTFWASVLKNASGMTTTRFNEALSGGLRQALDERRRGGNMNAALNTEVIIKAVAYEKTEIVKQSQALEMMLPEQMSNVGGLDRLKDWTKLRSHCFSEEAKKFGIEAPKGILLAGPPGTGKSLCAKAIANELKLPLIKFDISRIFDKYVGQSEAKIRSTLKMIDSMSPCVLLIDEIDKVFTVGQSGDSGVGTRVLGSLLTWMQETSSNVFTVMTANRVNNLPSELVRKGRLDEIFSVTIPTGEEITEIVGIHLKKRGHAPEHIEGLDVLQAEAEGYVAAELEAAVKEALIESFTSKTPITGAMILGQLREMTPLSQAFAEDFKFMESWAANNARPSSKFQKKTQVKDSGSNVSKIGRTKRTTGPLL